MIIKVLLGILLIFTTIQQKASMFNSSTLPLPSQDAIDFYSNKDYFLFTLTCRDPKNPGFTLDTYELQDNGWMLIDCVIYIPRSFLPQSRTRGRNIYLTVFPDLNIFLNQSITLKFQMIRKPHIENNGTYVPNKPFLALTIMRGQVHDYTDNDQLPDIDNIPAFSASIIPGFLLPPRKQQDIAVIRQPSGSIDNVQPPLAIPADSIIPLLPNFNIDIPNVPNDYHLPIFQTIDAIKAIDITIELPSSQVMPPKNNFLPFPIMLELNTISIPSQPAAMEIIEKPRGQDNGNTTTPIPPAIPSWTYLDNLKFANTLCCLTQNQQKWLFL